MKTAKCFMPDLKSFNFLKQILHFRVPPLTLLMEEDHVALMLVQHPEKVTIIVQLEITN